MSLLFKPVTYVYEKYAGSPNVYAVLVTAKQSTDLSCKGTILENRGKLLAEKNDNWQNLSHVSMRLLFKFQVKIYENGP